MLLDRFPDSLRDSYLDRLGCFLNRCQPYWSFFGNGYLGDGFFDFLNRHFFNNLSNLNGGHLLLAFARMSGG